MWVQLVSPVGNLGGYPGALGAEVGGFYFGAMENREKDATTGRGFAGEVGCQNRALHA